MLGDGHQSKEVVLKHLLKIDALCQINCQAFSDKIFRLVSNCNVLWEREGAGSDLFVCLLDFCRLKRRSTVQHCVKNDAD